MSDNFAISTASGERTIASDQISEVDFVRNKLVYGPDGTNTGDVQLASATAGGLPVQANACSDYVMAAGVGLTPKFAVISLTATGTLVAAVSSKKIRVLSCLFTMATESGDETCIFNSGAAGTALTGALGSTDTADATRNPLVVTYGYNPYGHFETVAGELLELALTGTTPLVYGNLQYIEV
jgi:hypothetical protein